MTNAISFSVTAALPSKSNGRREVPNLCCDGEAAEILRGCRFEDLVKTCKGGK